MCCPNCCASGSKDARYELKWRGDTLVAVLAAHARNTGRTPPPPPVRPAPLPNPVDRG